VAAICDVAAKPKMKSTIAESQNQRDCEKTISPSEAIKNIVPTHFNMPL